MGISSHRSGRWLALFAAAPLVQGPADPIPGMLEGISPERIRSRVERLVGFHTRNTFSETESDARGIGAARRWIEAELRAASEATGGRLEVRRQVFTATVRGREGSREVEIVNVYGFLPGTQGDPDGRTYVVSGHYDSMAASSFDVESFAPGADDDASGTAVVLELARVLSAFELEANLVFLCVAGEEQGLHGSRHFAEEARESGLAIDGMITNDIVGGVEGGDGTRDELTIRCFSGAEGLHSPSRELARTLKEAAERYVPEANVRLIFRLDRIGRGGDHIPFHEAGLPAVRLTEAHENYDRQHRLVEEVDGVHHGDLPEFVSEAYTARVARVNAACLAVLASAPAPPGKLVRRGAVRTTTTLRWDPSPSGSVAGYVVVWRETTSPVWQFRSELLSDTRTEIAAVADDFFFGVRAVDALGHESRTIVPRRP